MNDDRHVVIGDKLKLHWMELIHRAEVQVAIERARREAAVEAEYQAAFWQDILN